MFRFYFSILLVVVSLVNFNNVFAQKKQKNAPTVQKNSEIKAEYLFIKGEDYFIQQNYEKALTFFFDAEHNSPRNATLQYKIGECYFLLGNKEKALAFAKKAIHLDKTEKAFYLLLSTIYLNDKDYSTATKVYEDLIKNIKNPDIYYLDLAHITQQMLVNELQKYEFEVKYIKDRLL